MHYAKRRNIERKNTVATEQIEHFIDENSEWSVVMLSHKKVCCENAEPQSYIDR